jgi:hypothetical protein
LRNYSARYENRNYSPGRKVLRLAQLRCEQPQAQKRAKNKEKSANE